MFRRIGISIVLSILVMIVSACSASPATVTTQTEEVMTEAPVESEAETAPTATTAPTNTTAPTSTPRVIIWEDDFSDVTSGWERYRELDGVLDYVEGEEVYEMNVLAEDSLWWVWKEETLPDVGLSVDAWLVAGPEESLFGAMCRYDADNNDAYIFLINAKGEAGIGVIGEGYQFEPLSGGELTQFDVLQTGLDARNTIDILCAGEALQMSVNGELLFDLQATGFTGDDVGLVVVTSDESGANVYFDDLVIYEP